MLTNDVNLLVFEPALFGMWQIGHQQYGRGSSAALNGTSFSAAGEDFPAAGVQAGDVLYLASIDSVIDGCYEIVEVVSATQLIVSVLRGDAAEPPIAVGVGSNLIWRISTFAPQRAIAERMVSDRLELTPEMMEVMNENSLRRLKTAMIAAALALIFETLIQQDDDDDVFGRKKDVYRQMVEEAVCRLRLEMDTTGDGQTDVIHRGDDLQLKRR